MRALGWLIVCGCNAVPVASSAVATAPKPPQPAPADEPKIFAVPDELMEFGVSLRGIHVGVVQTAIGRPGMVDGHRELIVKSRGKTDGFAALIGDLKWELESTIDLDASLPLTSHEQAWIDFAGDKQHEDHTHKSDRGTGPRRHRCFLTRHQPSDPWHPQRSAEGQQDRVGQRHHRDCHKQRVPAGGSGCGTQDMQADLVGSQRCRAAADCHRNHDHEADQVLEQHDYRRRRELTCSFAQSAHQRDAEERQCGEDGTYSQVLGFVAGASSGHVRPPLASTGWQTDHKCQQRHQSMIQS
jgi:hypothetical protein